MQRVSKFFKEWYTLPGATLIGISIGLVVVLGIVGGLGGLTLDLLAY